MTLHSRRKIERQRENVVGIEGRLLPPVQVRVLQLVVVTLQVQNPDLHRPSFPSYHPYRPYYLQHHARPLPAEIAPIY